MKLITAKYLAILLAACSYAGSIRANYEFRDENCCRSSCYECRCEPLYECSWGLQVDVGVRPVLWHHRGDFLTVNCFSDSDTVVNDIGQLPKFNKLFKVPWQVGGQVSYALSCNTNVFVEFNYAQANFRHHDDLVRIGTSNLVLDLSKYKVFDGYFGARYYFDRWCDRTSFFFGGKVGFLHRKHIRTGTFSGIVNACNGSTVTDSRVNDLFAKHTSFAGGGHIGFDICFCGNWSFVITAEVVAACGPDGVHALALNNPDAANLGDASALLIPGVETELFFPVTFGVKYNF